MYLILSIICIIIVVCTIYIFWGNNFLITKEYTYKSKKLPKDFDGIKVLHISDLHSKRFGRNNINFIKKIEKINPDYIFMTGDIIDKREADVEEFVSELRPIFEKYRTYYSIGNHEKALGYKRYSKYLKALSEANVHVLKDRGEYLDKSKSINIVGLNFKDNIRYELDNDEDKKRDFFYSRKKCGKIDGNKFNILLAHDPLNFELYNKLGFDLVFSGHVHGGIVRFFKIGLLSPRRKLFPKYCYGKYTLGKSSMFVSSGIGKATMPIRLFNNPEMCIIKFKC